MPKTHDELDSFVREALLRGLPRQQIDAALLEAGWRRDKIDQALGAYAEVDFPVPVPRPQAYVSAREAFLYLLLFTTLFLSAFHLGAIFFELIDKALPDPAGSRFSADSLRWSVAFVVVSFPVYLFLTLRVSREMKDDPAMRGSRVRKWLTYMTLLVAAGFLLGDVVALLYNFLDGELSLRILLKCSVVAVIAGAAFGYYLHDLGKEDA